ncbi:hypothetical protein ACFXJ8_29645 [Nonomuraea sp. NPDC059194]|uniref:hypothetical protein n=1 Tax=Nonomuraea sp. NPDC059194 TaxID=3346764 RepID=UPI00368E315B
MRFHATSSPASVLRYRRSGYFVGNFFIATGTPFLLADALVAKGAAHEPAPDWQAQVVVDGRLATGQNPASAAPLAERVVELLK